MRLSEQREALVNTSAAPSPPANADDPAEPQFLTDEETLNQNIEEKADILEPLDQDTPVWLVGNHCSIADLCFLTWANVVDRIGIDLETEFPVSPTFQNHLTSIGSTEMDRQHDGKTSYPRSLVTRFWIPINQLLFFVVFCCNTSVFKSV